MIVIQNYSIYILTAGKNQQQMHLSTEDLNQRMQLPLQVSSTSYKYIYLNSEMTKKHLLKRGKRYQMITELHYRYM